MSRERKKWLIRIGVIAACLAVCWICDVWYWVIDIAENQIGWEPNMSMEG